MIRHLDSNEFYQRSLSTSQDKPDQEPTKNDDLSDISLDDLKESNESYMKCDSVLVKKDADEKSEHPQVVFELCMDEIVVNEEDDIVVE